MLERNSLDLGLNQSITNQIKENNPDLLWKPKWGIVHPNKAQTNQDETY